MSSEGGEGGGEGVSFVLLSRWEDSAAQDWSEGDCGEAEGSHAEQELHEQSELRVNAISIVRV